MLHRVFFRKYKHIIAPMILVLVLAACTVRNSKVSNFPTAQASAVIPATETIRASMGPSTTPTSTMEKTVPADLSEDVEITQAATNENSPVSDPDQALVIDHLHMLDGEHGWAMDQDQHLLVTRDGGSHWQDVTPWLGEYQWSGFFALDDQHAWLVPVHETCDGQVCSAFQIWRTSDGGQSWKAGQPICMGIDCGIDYQVLAEYAKPVQIQFTDQRNGWLLLTVQHQMMQDRYRIYKTTDGGSSWQFVSDSGSGPMLFHASGLAFLNEKSGWMTTSQVGGAEDPSPNWFIYHSIDEGKSWKKFHLPIPKNLPAGFNENTYWCGATEMAAISPQILDVVMACTVYVDEGTETYDFRFHSINAGKNWTSWQKFGKADFVNAAWGWRMQPTMNETYTLERSMDGGAHWNTVAEVPWVGALTFANELHGWALVREGEDAGLYQTMDGGDSWSILNPVLGQSADEPLAEQTPKEFVLSGANGETFPVVYYPPSTSEAPVVILMHQVNMDLNQWDAIARWLWKEDVSTYRDSSRPWLNSSWFPENTLVEKPAVLVFTYRDCGEGCYRPENRKILNDAQTVLEYVLNQPEIDPERITVVGTSVGADAALDACFLLQDKTDFNCENVLTVSPGSYLNYEYISVVKVMSKTPTQLYCYADRGDIGSANLCMGTRASNNYRPIVGKGNQHGIELFAPDFEGNILKQLLQVIDE